MCGPGTYRSSDDESGNSVRRSHFVSALTSILFARLIYTMLSA